MDRLPEYTKRYMLTGLSATPEVIEALLKPVEPGSTLWDFTPDKTRFTLREILAHMADWDEIFRLRIERTRDEDEPDLPDVDEGQVAIDNDYAHSDPFESLRRLKASRPLLVDALRPLDAAQWERLAHRHFGPISIAYQAVLILGHDGYHTQQIAQWLKAASE